MIVLTIENYFKIPNNRLSNFGKGDIFSMKGNLLVPLIIVSIVGASGIGAMTGLFIVKNKQLNDLQETNDVLVDDHSALNETHEALVAAFQALLGTNEDLEIEIEGIMAFVKALPIVDKMTYYYHLCRYVCFDHTSDQTTADSGAEMILHGSSQYNAFSEVDTVLTEYDFWEFGGSMNDAWAAVENVFCVSQDDIDPAWLDCWDGTNDEADIFQWVRNNIDYTLDSVTLYNRVVPFDLFLSPLEMLKYKRGDCDDFSILLAAMMENNGFDTNFGIVHDYDHPDYQPGGFHHAFIWVQIDPLDYPTADLWTFGGDYDWLIVDVTPDWTNNIGENPSWLQHYFDTAFSDWGSIFTWSFADPPTTASLQSTGSFILQE